MADETITRDELAAWFQRFHYGDDGGELGVKVGERAADNAFADILARREPEYERGRFYQDATGAVFFRLLGDGDRWSLMPQGSPYTHDYPRRPLRKLVPVPDREAIRAALEDGLYSAMPYSVDGLADRILKLLDTPEAGRA